MLQSCAASIFEHALNSETAEEHGQVRRKLSWDECVEVARSYLESCLCVAVEDEGTLNEAQRKELLIRWCGVGEQFMEPAADNTESDLPF